VEGFCEHGNEPSGSIKYWEFLEWLHNWQLLMKGSAPCVSELSPLSHSVVTAWNYQKRGAENSVSSHIPICFWFRGFHECGNEDFDLLGYGTEQFRKGLPTFRKNLLPPC
jgi:hypothetical protein